MALETFDLYDVLTDVIPGIIFQVLLVVLFVPPEFLKADDYIFGTSGIVLLVIVTGYVLGRLVRNVSLFEKILKDYFDSVLSNILEGYPVNLPASTIHEFKTILRGENFYLLYTKITRKQVKQWGYSKLYGRTTLYHKYTIISEFYYSMSKVFTISSIIYTPIIFLDIKQPPLSANQTYLIVIMLLVLGIICWTQHRKFSERRAIAFVNDLVTLHNEESKKTAG